jgi:hypothetical protein
MLTQVRADEEPALLAEMCAGLAEVLHDQATRFYSRLRGSSWPAYPMGRRAAAIVARERVLAFEEYEAANPMPMERSLERSRWQKAFLLAGVNKFRAERDSLWNERAA